MPQDSDSRELVPHLPAAVPAKKQQGAKQEREFPRVPPAVEGVQANFCRNVNCENFGVPPAAKVTRGRPKSGQPVGDGYQLDAGKKSKGKKILCTKCDQRFSIKSNLAIVEELHRLSAYLEEESKTEPSCPHEGCANHGVSIATKGRYQRYGRTEAGSQRWLCNSCEKKFSEPERDRKRPCSHEEALLFRMLVNKVNLRSIADILEISLPTVYAKIDLIHAKCLAFLADRERRLPELGLRRLYLCADRQDFVLNWTNRHNKRNVALTAVATADNRSGYVFGMNSNYDPSIDTADMEAQAIAAGDFGIPDPSHRRYARFWTTPDFDEARTDDPRAVTAPVSNSGDVWGNVADGYKEIEALPDPEAKERLPKQSMLPARGSQVHFEYTVHAHFRLLKEMLGPVGKIRFFMDQDETLRAACITTFAEEIKAGTADAFYVRIDKGMYNEQRDQLVAASTAELEAHKLRVGRPEMTDWRAAVELIEIELTKMQQVTLRDRWIRHPNGTGGEPMKAICWLTDREGVSVSVRQAAIVFARASLHTVDRYFMLLRRKVSALERPIQTASNEGRVWHGYAPYNPELLQKLLDIYRCFYNFVHIPRKSRDKRTPAMRLGLARGPIRVSDILYFRADGE